MCSQCVVGIGATQLAGTTLCRREASAANRRLRLCQVSSRRLEGPANDVPRVRDVLKSRGFADIQIVADRLGADTPLPTRANIMRAFETMSNRLSNGDFLFLYFSGHGAQQPVVSKKNEELDGVDEVLLPSDAGRLNETLTIQNAIVDDEIGQFITACRKRGAFVWAVVDACHAGDSTRDAPLPAGARERGLKSSDFAYPQWVQRLLDSVPGAERTTRLGQVDICGAAQAQTTAGLLAFFACRSNQKTIELPLSTGQSGRRYTGLFTHVLLNQLKALENAGAATYLDLVKRVQHAYAEEWQGWNWQPQFCSDSAHEIAGRRIFT